MGRIKLSFLLMYLVLLCTQLKATTSLVIQPERTTLNESVTPNASETLNASETPNSFVSNTDANSSNPSTKVQSQKEKGFFKRWLKKILIKKLQKKINAKREYNQYTKKSKLALGLSIVSFLAFWPVMLMTVSPFAWAILIAVLAGTIVADVISIKVLSKTKNNKAEFKKERTFSKIALILGGLFFLIPIIAIIALFINLNSCC